MFAKPAVLFTAAVVAVGVTYARPAASPPSAETVSGHWSSLQLVRYTELGDLGVHGPTGLAWSEGLDALVMSDRAGGNTRVAAVTPDEYTAGSATLPPDMTVGQVAVHPDTGSVAVVGRSAAHEVAEGAVRSGSRQGGRTLPVLPGVLDPDGATYDDSGRLVALQDGDLIAEAAGGGAERLPTGLDGHDLGGLTTDPATGELYTLDLTDRRLLALGADGQVIASFDASDVEFDDVRGLAFGPSADSTDDPSVTHLYILDAGKPGAAGVVLETALEPVGLAAHFTVSSAQVRTVATSSYSPPSPDPSGVTYIPSADRLLIVDGEVDEMTIYQGSNIFVTDRPGALRDKGDTQPWSKEPTGSGYNPITRRLYVSDDSKRDVHEVVAGSDGRFGTGDDTVTSFDTAAFGNTDPEGLDYDTATNSVWVVDGIDKEVFRYRPGSDGRFGTSDDIRSQFDIGRYGAGDPEGLAYDSARDTIAVIDSSSQTIYELDKAGGLLNTVDISAAGMRAAAGLTLAPSTSGSGRSYYAVARGVDNDSNPNENDGRLYELKIDLGGGGTPQNTPPVVNAGPDQTVVLPGTASLSGSVQDDGLPVPPGAVTTTWSRVSGPGTVTFADASSPSTTASFSTDGQYVLRLTASDGAATASDEVTVVVSPAGGGGGGTQTVEVRVSAGSDDAEQRLTGSVSLTSSDLELTTDGTTQQVVGLRFAGLQVPQGATVTNAYVQFRADEVSTGAVSLTIKAEASDNAATYSSTSGNVTSRATTAASVAWSPPDWSVKGEAGAAQRTPNLASLVQAVVSRAGWAQGRALAIQVSGTGRRTAEAFEGGATLAPLLHVEYSGGGGDPVNAAPTVDAGPDRSVTMPGSVVLDATVSDDGLPGTGLSYAWTKVSGPGVATFSPGDAEDTSVSFTAAGTYVLKLTASDGELSGSDQVTVTVSAEPPGGGGGSQTVEVRVAAGSDDAEQRLTGSVSLTSSDLELTTDGTTQQVVGLRFAGLQVPRGATVTNAYVQFRTNEVSTGAVSLTLKTEAADNAATYSSTSGNVTSRATTTTSVGWSPPDWSVKGEAGAAQRTPNLASLVQAVVSRAGWAPGNALAVQVSGTGRRTADAFEYGASFAPLLHVEYTTG